MTDLTGWTTGPEANRWRALYKQALASGDPELIAEGGALMRPVELMARATESLPAIALLMPGLVACDGSDALERRVLADGRRLAGDLLAATGRALEAHAREVGYRPDEWITVGLISAQIAYAASPFGRRAIIYHLEDATYAISAAIAATVCDLMLVPNRLSSAIAGGLALYATITDGPCA